MRVGPIGRKSARGLDSTAHVQKRPSADILQQQQQKQQQLYFSRLLLHFQYI